MRLYLSIERDLAAGLHKSGRFRCKIASAEKGPNLFMSTRAAGSVTLAKRDAENIFGEIAWKDASNGDAIRSSAEIEIE